MSLNLGKKGFDVPPPAKLRTFLKKLNDLKYGQEKIDCGTLEKWLEESKQVPESDTQPFVMRYEMNYEDEKNIEFRFVVTTKLLLKNAIDSNRVHADATYKLIWQGFPVLMNGFTDMNRKFHPTCVAVCTSEQEKDFVFIFASVRQGFKDIFNFEFDPDYLIADAAPQISNAGIKVFGSDIKIVMCWYHMHKNVAAKVPAFLKEVKKQNEFLSDLEQLQVAKSTAIFDIAVELFMAKWRAESEPLIEYFENQWVLKNRFWYEAFALLIPSTNNALEAKNRLIKDEHTLRERMDLGKFRFTLFAMVESWSNAYVSGLDSIAKDAPHIEMKMWTEGYNFAKANGKVTSRRRGNTIIYRSFCAETIDDSTEWPDFDSFKKKSFSFYDTTFNYPVKRENWLQGKCDCKDYFKLYICRHIIGIAIRLKCITPPAEAKTVPIGQKRKRGRPAKAKAALLVQN